MTLTLYKSSINQITDNKSGFAECLFILFFAGYRYPYALGTLPCDTGMNRQKASPDTPVPFSG